MINDEYTGTYVFNTPSAVDTCLRALKCRCSDVPRGPAM